MPLYVTSLILNHAWIEFPRNQMVNSSSVTVELNCFNVFYICLNHPSPPPSPSLQPPTHTALAHNQSHDRFSDTKSFDSWSESLSDSDSSSFYSNSDSSDESDADTSARNKSAPNRAAKKLSASKRSQKNTKQPDTLSQSSSSRGSKQSAGIDGSKIQAGVGGAGGKSARSLAEKEAKKPPIKMVFTKIVSYCIFLPTCDVNVNLALLIYPPSASALEKGPTY